MSNEIKQDPNLIVCSSCGYPNPLWAVNCEKCFKKLSYSGVSDIAKRRAIRSRPGCVTAYAIMLFVGVGLTVFSGFLFSLLLVGKNSGDSLSSDVLGMNKLGTTGIFGAAIVLGVCAVFAIYYFVLGWGLWKLKNWARIIVIISQGLGLLGNMLAIIIPLMISAVAKTPGNSLVSITSGIFNLAVTGIVVYWFSTNGDYFNQ